MFRNFIISVIVMVMLPGCANMSKDEFNETAGMITTMMAEFGPGALLFIPVGIVASVRNAIRDREIEQRKQEELEPSMIATGPYCTIYYCKQNHCGSSRVYIHSGKPDIDLDEFLKDTIPEKTHHNCPVEN